MEYLKPLDFYEQIFKDISRKKYHSKPGRFLCFDVSDKYVSLAVSDWKNKTAVPLRALDRQENNSTSADLFQSLISEYNIVGFVVGTRDTNSIDAQTQIFIDELCEAGNFEDFKYSTSITSENGEFIFKQILNFVLENLKLSLPQNIMEMAYAVCALQTYLDNMNKMVDGSNKKSIMRSASIIPSAATQPSSLQDTVPQMEYLEPLDFFKEIFKEILGNGYDLNSGRLLGLHLSENYVSLSVSDWKNKTAVPLRALDRQENNPTSDAADLFQSLINEHNIVGFVVGTSKDRPIDTQAQSFIDNLCKDGKFKELKYTFWDYSITSKHAEFVFNRHLQFILENLNQPKNLNLTIMEMCYAVPALQGFLDITNKMVEEDWNI